MIEASQRMITINSQGEGINPAINRHLELEIKTLLQNAPIDAGKVRSTFESKGKAKGGSNAHRVHRKASYRNWNAPGCIAFGQQIERRSTYYIG
jgi:hypothetical protein